VRHGGDTEHYATVILELMLLGIKITGTCFAITGNLVTELGGFGLRRGFKS